MGRIAEAIKRAERERSSLNNARFDAIAETTSANLRDAIGDAGAFDATIDFADAAPIGVDPSLAGASGRSRIAAPKHRFSPLPRHVMTDDAGIAPTPRWNVHSTVVVARERSSAVAEQYRAARTWLLRRNTAGKRSCVAITSSMPKEGKSVTTANLAIAMAEVRHLNVLAVDCDFRQGSIARLYKMPNTPGLADVITGRVALDDAIAATPIGNLSLLPAGACHDLSSGELINSKAACRVFDELRERFHVVLVDTPPVQSLSDVGAIGALCTGIVMVVRMNKTAAHLVRQSLHWLQSNQLNVLGCIAADCRTRGARYEYDDIGEDDE